MNNLYLTDFEAQNFRCFGSVKLRFRPEPGVIILVGPNGLGKTSWFEAVEIALTGRVARWQDVEERVKVKVLAVRRNEAHASVRLAFNRQSLEESPACWTSDGRSPLGAENLLCENTHSWGLTKDNFAGFLRATHFFPQSASMRTLHKPPEDRWEQILRHVSGFDQLARLSENLGQGVLRAITDIGTSLEMRRLSRQDQLEVWQSRLLKLRGMERSRKKQGEVLSPVDAAELLGDILPQNQPNSLLNNMADATRVLAEIDNRIGELGEAERALEDSLARLVGLREASSEWIGIDEELRQLSVSLQEYDKIIVSVRSETESAKSWLAVVESEYSRLLTDRDRSLQLLGEINEILDLRKQEEVAIIKLATSGQASAIAKTNLLAAENSILEVRSRSEQHRLLEASWQALNERQTALKAALAQRVHLRSLESSIAQIDGDTRILELEASAAALLLSELKLELREENVRREKATRDLESARAQTEALQDAVSTILEHLSSSSHECPVCQASYSNDGELMRRAGEAVSRLSPLLARAGEDLRMHEERRAKVIESLESAQHRHSALCESLETVTVRGRELRTELEAIRASLLLAHVGVGDEALDQEMAVLSEQGQELLAERNQFSGLKPAIEEQLRESLLLMERARHHLQETSHAELQARNWVDGLVIRRTALEARLDGASDTELFTRRDMVISQLMQQEDAVASVNRRLSSARAALETRKIETRERSAEREREVARLGERRSSLLRLEGRWRDAGLPGIPNAHVFSSEEQRLQEQKAFLGSNRQEVRRTRSRLAAWVADLEIRGERASMGEIAGGLDDRTLDEYTSRLSRSIEDCVRSGIQAETASKIAKQLSGASHAKKGSLYRTLQTDLETSLVQLLPLLIKDPNFHNIVASIETSKRSTSFSPRDVGGVQVEAFASEGQLSGLGFSVQLSMALAFPWSRWRGLLLDDPLQYSDIVHTSNLVEVLRLLARQQGFQIFISTHERSLADYVFRKFRNAGLSAERIVFRDAPDGVGGIPIQLP